MINNPKVLVVGDLMLDVYIRGNCYRISPEAPVPIISIPPGYTGGKHIGGAGNVVSNLSGLGIPAYIHGVVGDDEAGRYIINTLDGMTDVVNAAGQLPTAQGGWLAAN